MLEPSQPCRFLVSPGLIPESVSRTRTSPGPGSGSGSSPTCSTSAAGPCRSYQTARMPFLLRPRRDASLPDESDGGDVTPRRAAARAHTRCTGRPAGRHRAFTEGEDVPTPAAPSLLLRALPARRTGTSPVLPPGAVDETRRPPAGRRNVRRAVLGGPDDPRSAPPLLWLLL